MEVKDISSVKAALVLILEKADVESSLTRVHFHCLTYHIILERKGGPSGFCVNSTFLCSFKR